MSDVKPKIEGAPRSNYRKPNITPKTTSFSAPTSGLEDVIFDYGPSMKQGRFKTNVELLAEFMSSDLKKGGPATTRAIKNRKAPTFTLPKVLTRDEEAKLSTMEIRVKSHEYEEIYRDQQQWKHNNSVTFSKYLSHSTPSMRAKLQGMGKWETIEDEQDGLGLIGLLQAITFQQDGSKIGMLSLVEATKNLYLCFQRREWTLDGYATEFKARVQACEALGLSIGLDDGIVEAVAADEEPSLDWETIKDDSAKYTKYAGLAEKRFQAALLFSGLNAEAYGTLKNTVKNAWTTSGINSLPKTTADVIKMADEFVDPRTSKRVRANAQPGVAFITPGEEVSLSPKPTSGKANKSKAKISDAKPKSGEPVKHPDSGKLVESQQ